MAACPEVVATAAVPPLRAADRFSKTATVGLSNQHVSVLQSVDSIEYFLTKTYVGDATVEVAPFLHGTDALGVFAVCKNEGLQRI